MWRAQAANLLDRWEGLAGMQRAAQHPLVTTRPRTTQRQAVLVVESIQEIVEAMPELAPALQRLDEIAKIAPEDHPYGAERTTERAVMAARMLLVLANVRYQEFVDASVIPYFIGPIPDGGVQMKWRSGHAQLWLISHPSRGYGYLFEDKTRPGTFEENDDIPLQEALRLIGKVLSPRS